MTCFRKRVIFINLKEALLGSGDYANSFFCVGIPMLNNKKLEKSKIGNEFTFLCALVSLPCFCCGSMRSAAAGN
jgi:hypothetical protein